jgi:hypothetical protein
MARKTQKAKAKAPQAPKEPKKEKAPITDAANETGKQDPKTPEPNAPDATKGTDEQTKTPEPPKVDTPKAPEKQAPKEKTFHEMVQGVISDMESVTAGLEAVISHNLKGNKSVTRLNGFKKNMFQLQKDMSVYLND